MSKNTSNTGTSFVSLLGVAFIVLKLTGYIDWSWWYVTLPLWLGFVILSTALIVMYLLNKFIKK